MLSSRDAVAELRLTAPTATTTPSPVDAPAARRLDGVDVARALAILGMVTVHFGPRRPPGDDLAGWVYGSFYGKASVLFVVVAGIGVALMSRGGRDLVEVRARLVYRTLWLVPLGLWLQTLEHPVAVILQYYGLYFLALTPFVGRRGRTLLVWVAVLLPLGSAAVLAAQVLVPSWVRPLAGRDSPLGVPGDLLLLGYYPLVSWLAPMLVGLWLGGRDLAARRVQAWLVAGGVALLAGTTWLGRGLVAWTDLRPDDRSWTWVLSTRGHSEMPLAIVGAAGFALAVLGVCLFLAGRFPRTLRPLAAAGRLALTIYVGHLIVYALVPDLFAADTVAEGVRTVLGFGLVTTIGAAVWLRGFDRGPLEATVRWPYLHLVVPAVRRWRTARRASTPDGPERPGDGPPPR